MNMSIYNEGDIVEIVKDDSAMGQIGRVIQVTDNETGPYLVELPRPWGVIPYGAEDLQKSENILFIGHKADTDAHVRQMVGNSAYMPVHHTISDIGIHEVIRQARETGNVILAMDIAEYRSECKRILVDELNKGGFRCIATSGACPCDGYSFNGACRCTQSQKERWNNRIAMLEPTFKVVRL